MATLQQLEWMEQACRAAAMRYDRGRGVRDDLEQAAWVEVLRAVKTYDPTQEFYPYVWVVALRACKRALVELSIPLSGLKHRPEVAEGVTRTVAEAAEWKADESDGPRDVYERAAIDAKVRARLTKLFGEQGVPFALSVLTGEHHSTDIATYHNVNVRYVRRLASHVRKLCTGDEELYRLWKEELDL
jgi:DNA-directed RNA polymerase specialized sigma24 family protein